MKYFHGQSCSVMTMSPEKKDYGHHSYPLERIETAVQFLKKSGYEKIGIVGLSTTGMVALAAASFISASEAVKSIFGESRYVVKKNYVAGGDINEACTQHNGSLCEP